MSKTYAAIRGTGHFLPDQHLTNQDLFQKISGFNLERASHSLSKKGTDIGGKSEADIFDLWVQQVCGIRERTYVLEDFSEDGFVIEKMAEAASRKALDDAGLEASAIDHIIFSSYSGNVVMPGPAASLSQRLGVEDCSGTNINGACSGFLDGLIDAAIKVESGYFKNVLVVASEQLSNKMDFTDITTCILFSDGAGAAVVSTSDQPGVLSFSSRLKFNNEHITMNWGDAIHMGGGPLVQRKAVQAMNEVSQAALEKGHQTVSDLDFVIPHQANIRIIRSLEEKMGLDSSKMVKCIDKTGNLSSATIPVALDQMRRGQISPSYVPNSLGLFTSVGGGYTFSAVLLNI